MGRAQRKHEVKLQNSVNETNLKIHQMDNDFNERMANQSNQWNIEQWIREQEKADANWQRDAEYNSASAQVERYREAGLNPTIMMSGQGAGSATSSAVSSKNAPSASAASPIPMQAPPATGAQYQANIINALGGLNDSIKNHVDNRLAIEQVQGIKLDNQRKQQQMLYDLLEAQGRAQGTQAEGTLKALTANLFRDTYSDQVESSKYDAKIKAETAKKEQQAAIYQSLLTKNLPDKLALELSDLKMSTNLKDYQMKSIAGQLISEYEKEFGPLDSIMKQVVWEVINGAATGSNLLKSFPSIFKFGGK